jgi:hypothetical protein
MALLPSAFVQVRDHVTIENHDSKNKVSLRIYVSSGLVVLVPYASVLGIGSCTTESHPFDVDDCSHVLNVALLLHRSAYTVNAIVMWYMESHVA